MDQISLQSMEIDENEKYPESEFKTDLKDFKKSLQNIKNRSKYKRRTYGCRTFEKLSEKT